ncbi:MAG TPA: TonB-dependent receptor [Hyphomonadaceae bacterium]|nr:TonB-dependent receptor [Hyphomonadaceae bacterium]
MTPIKKFPFVSLIALSMAMPAFAQTPAPQAPPADDRASDVVVVTANKRQESVQDVAVAVTAITSETKQEMGVITVTDLTNVTPGLSYTPGNERVTLRGIGRLTNSFGADPGVANYNDGLYTPFAVMAGKDPTLIQRVEVLRGPQGTLYGRNAIGGAINTISKRPSNDFTTDFKYGLGDYGYNNIVAAVSGPINDSLRYRVVGQKEKRDGIDYNYGTGEKEGWEIDDYYLEGQLEGDIGDRFNWWVKVADSGYNKAGPPGGRTATFSTAPFLPDFAPTGNAGPNPAFAYSNPSVISFTQVGNRRDNPFATNGEHAYNTNYASTAKLDQYDEAIAEATYSTDWFDIKYTGGYTFYDYKLDSDGDGTPIQSITYNSLATVSTSPLCGGGAALPPVVGFPVSTFPSTVPAGFCYTAAPRTIYPSVLNTYAESRSLFSNEINLISTTDGPLQWIVGAYQYQENSKQPGQVQTLPNEPLAGAYLMPPRAATAQEPAVAPSIIANPNRIYQYFANTSLFNAYGLYGQLDYELNEQLKFTVGLRYSKDLKESKEEAFLACYILCTAQGAALYTNITGSQYAAVLDADPAVVGYDADLDARGYGVRRLNGSWEAVTGTAGVEFRPLDDTLLFAKYSRGYKAGGFNNLGFALNPYTDPEFVDSYEGGWKQTWDSLNLTTNAAAFFYVYTDAQAPLGVITTNPTTGLQSASTQFVNLPEVQTKGFELEATWNPIDPLNIGFTYAYLDAEITESGIYVDPSRGSTDPTARRSVVGNTLSQTPKNKVALNASYRIDMQDGSYWMPTVSYSWRDKFFDSFFNNANEESPAFDNVDARLNWKSADEHFGLTFWVRNLTDEEQTTSISANSFRVTDAARYQTFSYTAPRMAGVDFLFHY